MIRVGRDGGTSVQKGNGMKISQVAAQLYTVRDFTQTRAGFARSMAKIAEIGYSAVQVSAIGDIPDAEVKRIADDHGLTICNTHISYELLLNDLDAVIEQHKLWDSQHVAIGSMPPEFRDSEDGYRRFAEIGSEIGEKLAQSGLSFSYHNHSFEFVKFAGRTGLDILFGESDARYFQAELDTYWVQHGGADPAAWIGRLAGRMPVIHLKDMVMLPPPSQSPPIKRGDLRPLQTMAEVGEGNMNFAAILQSCRGAGVDWYAVEQDICQRDPFESLAISFRNLNALSLN